MTRPIRTRLHRLDLDLAPSYQDMWTALRERGTLRTTDLSDRTDDQRACRTFLLRLVRAGIAERLPAGRGNPIEVRLVQDLGPVAPTLTDGGSASRRGLITDQMWRTIRMHRQIDCRDLVIYGSTADVPIPPIQAQRYLGLLHRAGYLQLVEPGRQHRPAKYRLIPSKNTGPLPPRLIGMHGLFDDNIGQLVHGEEVRDAG